MCGAVHVAGVVWCSWVSCLPVCVVSINDWTRGSRPHETSEELDIECEAQIEMSGATSTDTNTKKSRGIYVYI